jgi:hypothetical protein
MGRAGRSSGTVRDLALSPASRASTVHLAREAASSVPKRNIIPLLAASFLTVPLVPLSKTPMTRTHRMVWI